MYSETCINQTINVGNLCWFSLYMYIPNTSPKLVQMRFGWDRFHCTFLYKMK